MYELINIIIPVYEEAETITGTIREIKNRIKTAHRIFIVYDAPDDSTLPVVKGLIEEGFDIRLVKNRYVRGALGAIRTGFDNADEGAVLVVMADLSDDLGRADEMFEQVNKGYDIVCGSRYMKGGKQLGGPLLKKTLSRMAGVSLHYLTGIPTHDVTNSFKMYSKNVLNSIQIESNGGFELGMEIVIKAFLKGLTITEIPVTWRDRYDGESKFKLWKWLPKYIYWYLFAIKGILLKTLGTGKKCQPIIK
jgi:glycosyltransferase involved in cell wall biosynthesis